MGRTDNITRHPPSSHFKKKERKELNKLGFKGHDYLNQLSEKIIVFINKLFKK